MRNQQSGFTLVEIAIVLVIIGLLLGGVLKGQELITQAKIKNVANDLNGLAAATYGYQDRYKAYPGDDLNAGTRWTSPSTAIGDGNARVGSTSASIIECTDTGTQENCLFWQHLRLSGFIGGDAASRRNPQNALNGIIQVQDGALGLSGLVVCTTNLPGKVANAIDAQFDDGKPNTGKMRGVAGSGTTYTMNTAPTITAYTDDGATLYVVCQPI